MTVSQLFLRGARILVLEDTTPTDSAPFKLQAVLQRYGADVEVHRDADQALAQLEQAASSRPFHVVVVDVDVAEPHIGDGLAQAMMAHNHPAIRSAARLSYSAAYRNTEALPVGTYAARIAKGGAQPLRDLISAVRAAAVEAGVLSEPTTSAPQSQGVRPSRYPSLDGLRVLLLDDQAEGGGDMGFGIVRLITRLGGTVQTSASVDQAIALLSSTPAEQMPHGVIVDYQLRDDRPGTDLAQWLAAHHDARVRAIQRICYSGMSRSQILASLPLDVFGNGGIIQKGESDSVQTLLGLLAQVRPAPGA